MHQLDEQDGQLEATQIASFVRPHPVRRDRRPLPGPRRKPRALSRESNASIQRRLYSIKQRLAPLRRYALPSARVVASLTEAPLRAGQLTQRGDQETHWMGGDHRGAHTDLRHLRHELRPLSGRRGTVRILVRTHIDSDQRHGPLRLFEAKGLDLTVASGPLGGC